MHPRTENTPPASDPATTGSADSPESSESAAPPTLEADDPKSPETGNSRLKRYIKRFGVAGFLFFFIKGLLWLLIPLLIALGWFGGK